MTSIEIPELSLVALIGPSGSGKSTFAKKHFSPTEVISSDDCRGLVSDDENSQEATSDAFDLLFTIAAKRLKNGRLTVIDATSVQAEDRKKLIKLAREYHCLPTAIVLDMPEDLCQERNKSRPDRTFGPHVIRNQKRALRQGMGRNRKGLQREGFRYVKVLNSPEEVEAATITRTPLWNNKKGEHGPFDIVGDVHGCYDELVSLIGELGYGISPPDPGAAEGDLAITCPTTSDGGPRKLVFVGDLVDRGPKSPAVLRLVMRLVSEGKALCVPGNHDTKLQRKLFGKNVQITHGLGETLEQLDRETPEFVESARQFIDGLISHYVLDDGKLVVAHAGLKESMQGRGSGKVREFCLYGETTGETDEFGLPVRHDWAAEYRGRAMVVYGHTPVPEAEWLNGTICIDTGCVFGGHLTAMRYPERDLVSVAAHAKYAEPKRPLIPDDDRPLSAQQQNDRMLHIEDVIGKRYIDTPLVSNITIREENAAAALEVMSRFAVDPKWLIHLPPTMSPSETSAKPGYLEYPEESLTHYRARGVSEVICEEKHMGSRSIAILCKDEETARERFGVTSGEIGTVYTRTGRRFFDDAAVEREFLEELRGAISEAGLWDELESPWIALDAELMPWSAKAQALLKRQYAPVGSAATASLPAAVEALRATAERLDSSDVSELAAQYSVRETAIHDYVAAYGHYCWSVSSIQDLKFAPFHILASEGRVHSDRPHVEHMALLSRIAEKSPIVIATDHKIVNLTDAESCAAATEWWEAMTSRGGEGMVVKPRDYVTRGTKGIVQPALKCRGPEYLRIIYGPEYRTPQNLERLRKRGLKHKRGLANREFALGLEALARFVRREPLRRVHECVFGVLALESEPVDPRL